MNDADGLDSTFGICRKARLDRRGVGTVPPVSGKKLDVQPMADGNTTPQGGEVAGLDHQNAVTGT